MTSLSELKRFYRKKLQDFHFDEQTKFRCQQCKGLGRLTIQTTKTKITQSIPCFPCDGKGYNTISEVLTLLVNNNSWCECRDLYDVSFFDDNQHEGCINKHHYHCEMCGLLTQIG